MTKKCSGDTIINRSIRPINAQENTPERVDAAEGHEMDEEEDAHGELEEDPDICIVCDPGSPTKEEKEKHDMTHNPYRSWCPVCVWKPEGKKIHIAGKTQRVKERFQ